MKRVYPIVLTPRGDGGYLVYMPSFNIDTEGENLADAIDMARDAMSVCGLANEDIGKEIPQSCTLLPMIESNELTALVDVDFDAYRKQYDTKAVKKTLTIPAWLNTRAEVAHVNYSQILQEGIKTKLGIA